MTSTSRSLLVLLAMSLLALGCAAPTDEPATNADFTEWASETLVPFEGDGLASARVDSNLLAGAVGSARLVGLGESRHDTSEQFLVKGSIVRQLVEEQGFRALLLEESLAHARAIDRWVRGGDGELEGVMQEIAGWYLWDVEEMHGLLRWMRAFNEGREAGDQVRVFGVDITAPAQGVREVLAALESRGTDSGLDEGKLGLELQEGDYWPATWERYRGLVEERRDELVANYAALVQASRALKDERLRMLAEAGQRGNALFLATTIEEGGQLRERGMTDSTLWILENEIPDHRAILWAHNLHVAKASFVMPGLAEGPLTPMGVYLSETLGDEYLAIGATFGRGRFENDPEDDEDDMVFELPEADVLDGALARLGEKTFLLDLRAAPATSRAGTWLAESRTWLAQGASAEIVVRDAVDILYFVDEVARATPSDNARQRLRRLGN